MADELHSIGKLLMIAGLITAVLGGLLILSSKTHWLGRLPGDFIIQRKNFTFYLPLTTSILLSMLISFIVWLLGRR